jgi:hypothetical protein
MPLFWKPYKSDVTTFIEALKAAKPTLESRTACRPRPAVGPHDRPRSAWPNGAMPRAPAAYVYQTKADA